VVNNLSKFSLFSFFNDKYLGNNSRNTKHVQQNYFPAILISPILNAQKPLLFYRFCCFPFRFRFSALKL